MAVPSTGRYLYLVLQWRWFMLIIKNHNQYRVYSSPTDRADHQLYDSNAEVINDFYSPHATMQRTPSSPAPNKDFDSSEFVSQNYDSNTNSIGDISLTAMSTVHPKQQFHPL